RSLKKTKFRSESTDTTILTTSVSRRSVAASRAGQRHCGPAGSAARTQASAILRADGFIGSIITGADESLLVRSQTSSAVVEGNVMAERGLDAGGHDKAQFGDTVPVEVVCGKPFDRTAVLEHDAGHRNFDLYADAFGKSGHEDIHFDERASVRI